MIKWEHHTGVEYDVCQQQIQTQSAAPRASGVVIKIKI